MCCFLQQQQQLLLYCPRLLRTWSCVTHDDHFAIVIAGPRSAARHDTVHDCCFAIAMFASGVVVADLVDFLSFDVTSGNFINNNNKNVNTSFIKTIANNVSFPSLVYRLHVLFLCVVEGLNYMGTVFAMVLLLLTAFNMTSYVVVVADPQSSWL